MNESNALGNRCRLSNGWPWDGKARDVMQIPRTAVTAVRQSERGTKYLPGVTHKTKGDGPSPLTNRAIVIMPGLPKDYGLLGRHESLVVIPGISVVAGTQEGSLRAERCRARPPSIRPGTPGRRGDRPPPQILLRLKGKPSRIPSQNAHTPQTITASLSYGSITQARWRARRCRGSASTTPAASRPAAPRSRRSP